MCSKNVVEDMPPIELQEKVCEGCTLGKHHRNSSPIRRTWGSFHPLELVHSDLFGLMHTTSIRDISISSHLLMIIVERHGISFLKEKSKVYEYLKPSRLWLKGKVASH